MNLPINLQTKHAISVVAMKIESQSCFFDTVDRPKKTNIIASQLNSN